MRKKLVSILFIIFAFCLPSCSFFETGYSYIVIYGDSRTNHSVHEAIVSAIMKYKPRVVFHTGDMVDNSRSDWEIFNKITAKLRKRAKFYPALGNHEYKAELGAFFDNFKLPNNEQWYSIEHNGIHFIVLNSYASIDKGSEQYAWLVSDLESIRNDIKFTIAVFHHPPISSQYTLTKRLRPLIDVVVPLFEEHGVDVVFNGHVHAYERCQKNNIYYITTGGGGAALKPLINTHPYSQKYIATHHFCVLHFEGDSLVIEVLNRRLDLIDKVTLQANNESY